MKGPSRRALLIAAGWLREKTGQPRGYLLRGSRASRSAPSAPSPPGRQAAPWTSGLSRETVFASRVLLRLLEGSICLGAGLCVQASCMCVCMCVGWWLRWLMKGHLARVVVKERASLCGRKGRHNAQTAPPPTSAASV
jgi:hypothetical protein